MEWMQLLTCWFVYSILVEEIKNTIIALGLSGQVNFGADEPRIVSTCRSTGNCCAPVLLICRILRISAAFWFWRMMLKEGRGSPDVLNSAVELLTGGPHQTGGPHVNDRMLETRQDKNVRGSMSLKEMRCYGTNHGELMKSTLNKDVTSVLEFAHRSITWSYTNTCGNYFYRQACVSHSLNFSLYFSFLALTTLPAGTCIYTCTDRSQTNRDYYLDLLVLVHPTYSN
jgi:hypothetical protein